MKRLAIAAALRAALPATLAAAIAAPAAADRITPIAEVRPGSQVTVKGTVERILDEDEFRLADSSGAIVIYLGPSPVPIRLDEEVTVEGHVDDDLLIVREIYATRLILADGTVIALAASDE